MFGPTKREIGTMLQAAPAFANHGVQHVFTSWSSLSEVKVGKQGIVLCHYAMKVWPHHSRGTWQLYGHSHGKLPDDPPSLSMDVGVDSHDFRPWHFEEIQAIMRTKAEARAMRLQDMSSPPNGRS